MIAEIDAIISKVILVEKEAELILNKIHPEYKKSAVNLLHYRSLRSHDLRKLQKQLGYLGLSPLAKSQSHVMASLETNKAILASLLNSTPLALPTNELSFKKGENASKRNAKKLLGYRTKGRRTRIMGTMPTEAADNYEMVKNMVAAGMNCARVNCAHDEPAIWKEIINIIRKAAEELNKKCKVAMDLAGPKIRTGEIVDGPMILKIRPNKDAFGKIAEPVSIWIGSAPKVGYVHVPISAKALNKLEGKDNLFF